MKRALLQPSLSALLGLAIAASASADKIYLSDGSIINDAQILTEGVKTVSYIPDGKKKKSDAKEVASELVLSVEYTQMPEDIAAAQVDADDEAFAAAIAGMEVYLENVSGKGDRKFPWAPAFARYRLVELYKLGGELPSMVTSADALVAEYPESRYVPLAMVEKIDALLGMGDVEQARGAIDALKAMVTSAGLPKRWEFEADVRKILTNPTLKGEGLEKELQSIVRAAAAFPTVSNFAAVARAESLVARGELAEAEKALRKVVGGPGSPRSHPRGGLHRPRRVPLQASGGGGEPRRGGCGLRRGPARLHARRRQLSLRVRLRGQVRLLRGPLLPGDRR